MSLASVNYSIRKYTDKNDVDLVADAIRNSQNVLLLGPRGSGKTSLAKVAVEGILKRKFVYIPCHTGATTETLLGQWIPNPTGAGYVWLDGILTAAVRKGRVCLLDEINSLKPEVAFAIHGLLDHRREIVLSEKPGPDGEPEVVTAHPEFGLIAAGNPLYEGVRVMNEAFRDRFAVQLIIGYNKEVDIAVFRNHPVCARLTVEMGEGVAAFIDKIRNATKSGAIHSDVSTRAFLDFAENCANHTLATAKMMFRARFDDEAEQNAVHTCFSEVWEDNGKPQKLLQDKVIDAKKTGRASRFGAGLQGSAGLAKSTF